ncbi:factor-independent urate hydroxylase [Paenarthrobacter sp. PH39-S1]|uniref:factor-independent urate hydroxylase n=1 Tax=Paenarthrobacter sp. PH39-S1 TaxID=3046204 RepID=UPI0024B87BFE|nr:urate oxidase [Paenarthrobacter sp. PH39-S1]MDJ0356218.1 urate oxidase [Paenarthrobacter sp. PH39-S1]
MSSNNIILGANQFGKAEVRVVKVTRDTDRHQIEDLNVTSELRGDFEAAHLEGDNAHVVPTDTQKNTVYAFAREGVGSPEKFLLRLAEHFTSGFEWVDGGRWAAESYSWDRIVADGSPHNHAFVKNGTETRTAVVVKDGNDVQVVGGLKGLTVLKTTQSGFEGFPVDKYTTLPETSERILSTEVAARWRYNTTDVDFNKSYDDVKALLLEGFTENYSTALQNTLYGMGKKVLEAHPEIDEIKFSMPNKHHFLVDLSPFGLDNPNEVFFAADRPYGLIEATVLREDASDAGRAWEGIAGFC